MRTRVTVAVVAIAVLALTFVVGQRLGDTGDEEAVTGNAVADQRPNMVFILMDDFSLELLQTMPAALTMQREGASYANAFVIDSMCCPSRAALLTGQTPHQTGVLTNTRTPGSKQVGGFPAFEQNGNLPKQFSVPLQEAGYTTGFIGKYMNRYTPIKVDGEVLPPPKLPGWTHFNAIVSGGYNEWGFRSTYVDENGDLQLREHPQPPLTAPESERDEHYGTNVMADMAIDFIEEHRDADAPYFLEIATYAPHSQLSKAYPDSPRFPSAYADRSPQGDPTGGNCGKPCSDLTLIDLPGYDDPRRDNAPTYLRPDGTTRRAPAWRTNPVNLRPRKALRQYRDRARMVQSIDRMLTRVREAVGPNTYVFLTADNGFHLGQHQLNGGKGTPYDSDTRVPLLVAGPGVVPGVRQQFVNNIDLASTFESLAGLRSPNYRAGTSFADTLQRPRAPGGRYAFFEHTWTKIRPGEVDADQGSHGVLDIIPSYIAVRGRRGLLVRFDLDNSWKGTRYAWELYRYNVPWEDRNVFARDHDKPWARDLMRRLKRFDGCAPKVCRRLTR